MSAARSSVRSGAAAIAASVLLLATGCSSSGSAPSAADAPGGADVRAQVEQFTALDAAAQESQLRVLSASIDRQLMTLSGLETELGGPANADAAYAALSKAALGMARGYVAQPDFGRFGAHLPAEDAPSIGGLMFGNFMIGALTQDVAVSNTNDVKPGSNPPPEQKDLMDPNSAGTGSIQATGDAAKADLQVGGTFTVDGVTGTLKTLISVAPCPDAKGQFTSTTTMTASVASAGGRTGSNLTIEMAIQGQVDDDAQLASFDVDTRTQSAQFESSKGQYVDQTVGWTVTGKDWSGYRGKVNRTGGNVTDAFVKDQGKWGLFTAIMMQDKAVQAAKRGWESGRCVTLEPTTAPAKRSRLDPSSVVTITAAPRSKIDGTPVRGSVTAALAGGASVDPSGSKVPADATFTYTAPGEKDKTGVVSLEARSKRGVAKADVAFDTKAGGYVASGGGSGITVTGSVPDLAAPFTLTGAGAGFTITFDYAPDATGRSGSLTYSGAGGGVTMKGTGTYTIAGDEGGVLTMTSSNQGCATPGGCRSHVETITLTPTK